MKIVFHAWPYGIFIEIQSNLRRKKLHRMNQSSNFLGGSFSNRDNVRAPIQFGRKSQPQHLNRWFFLKNRPMNLTLGDTTNLSNPVEIAIKKAENHPSVQIIKERICVD